MQITSLDAREASAFGLRVHHNQNEWTGRMYAIAFDLDTIALERHYLSPNWRNAYDDIARELRQHGFERQQGSVYFGRRGMTPVSCVLAAQALSKRYSWFAKVVRDMRMLRIEEENDLMPAIGQLDLPLSLGSAVASIYLLISLISNCLRRF